MPSKSVDLSIIILSYNTAQITKNCIESVIRSLNQQPLSYEIIVIDNASSDKSVKTLENIRFPLMRIIQNKKNIGFAQANNQGVSLAKGEYILFLNSDTVILDHAIYTLLSFYQKNPYIQFIGPKLLNADFTQQPSAAPFYSLPVIFGALFLKGDHWGLTRSSPTKTKKVDWVSGACILTKKQYLNKLNGFDEDIFMYMDEVDLLFRAKKQQLTTYFYSEAKIIHLGSGSSSGRTEPILQVYRGFYYFYKKHHSPLEQYLLKYMLQLKAYISLFIGAVTNNAYLKETYEKALKLA